MSERSANDTTSAARVVTEVYLIDPTTKLPTGPGGGSGGAVSISQSTPGTTNGVVLKDGDNQIIDLANPSTGALDSVNDSTTEGPVLAANANRKGATIFNDSTEVLYLALSDEVASATNYTVKMAPGGYYEVPFGYTGEINGLWANNASGAARVTELT